MRFIEASKIFIFTFTQTGSLNKNNGSCVETIDLIFPGLLDKNSYC